MVALTFDDGPHKSCTPKLLDGLKERGVHATFFLMGQSIPGNEDLVRRMQEEGHLIGNHSYSHIQLTHAGEEQVCRAVDIPVYAIGGISAGNFADVLSAGAAGGCVMSGPMACGNVDAYFQSFQKAGESHGI